MFTLLYNLTATCSWFSLEAEEYQKLAFPASEFVLNGLLPEEELKLWAPVPRMVEFVFNSGRNGWSEEMLDNFRWDKILGAPQQCGQTIIVNQSKPILVVVSMKPFTCQSFRRN